MGETSREGLARPEAAVLVSTDWTHAFAPLGLVPVEEIGSGMEGTVLRLQGDLVAKVWHSAGEDELVVRQRFCADVADALPLRTTRMLDVVQVGDRWASIEPLLHGTPLAGPPTDGAVARWVMQAHPIGVKERWETLRDSLRGAGLSVEGIVHLSRNNSDQEQKLIV